MQIFKIDNYTRFFYLKYKNPDKLSFYIYNLKMKKQKNSIFLKLYYI